MLPLFISYRSSGEKLIRYQANSSCVIMSVILMTTLFYKTLILQGEIWCWSLLGLKGLSLMFVAAFADEIRKMLSSKFHAFVSKRKVVRDLWIRWRTWRRNVFLLICVVVDLLRAMLHPRKDISVATKIVSTTQHCKLTLHVCFGQWFKL